MKRPAIALLALATTILCSAPLAAAGKGKPVAPPCDGLITYMSTLPAQPLGDAEKAGLLFTWEEEKLARDVYVVMAGKWGQRAFTNIAASEQTHMDATAFLLERYALAIPVPGATPGVFSNPRLAALYVSLVEQGGASLVDALTVGATIEDLDIADVESLLAGADNLDVRTLTQNLAKGSRNHLRSFVGLLDSYEVAYVPQFISPAEFAEIIATEAEHKVIYDADGNPVDGILAGPCSASNTKK